LTDEGLMLLHATARSEGLSADKYILENNKALLPPVTAGA
jgi:hypothetical protein